MMTSEFMYDQLKRSMPERAAEIKEVITSIEQLWLLNPEMQFGEVVDGLLDYTGKEMPSELMDAEISYCVSDSYYRA